MLSTKDFYPSVRHVVVLCRNNALSDFLSYDKNTIVLFLSLVNTLSGSINTEVRTNLRFSTEITVYLGDSMRYANSYLSMDITIDELE